MRKEFVLVHGFDLARFHALGVPRTYVRCLRDAVAPVDLDTAHNPMVSAADRLAALLAKI